MTKPLFALLGNPNSGKTTVFNAYTGSRQHVGNYPGITVEKKEGVAYVKDQAVTILDLPGIYSLSAYSPEERVARRAIIEEKPDVVIQIVSANCLERNLFLTIQLLELGVPLVIGLNMIDESIRDGIVIDYEKISERLNVAIIPTVAKTGQGLDELLVKAYELSQTKEKTQALEISYGSDLDLVLDKMTGVIKSGFSFEQAYTARWLALKYLENDLDIVDYIRKSKSDIVVKLDELIATVSEHIRQTLNMNYEAIIADYRYGYISGVLKGGLISRKEQDEERILSSDLLDNILTHRYFGPLFMLVVLYAMYQITFSLGAYPMDWVTGAFGAIRNFLDNIMPDGQLKSLLLSGIIDGVGGVLTFVPLILIIFVQIAILEDSGYTARMAYMLDRIFRIFGLHGLSVMPYILGGGIAGGCAVPGILATRTLRSKKEKLATILTIPFMSCGAKLPIFLLFAAVFFQGNEALVMFSLSLISWVVALLSARIIRSTIVRGPSTAFVMELPPYRLPTAKGVCIHAFERTFEYLKKAATVILAISIVLWAAMSYPLLPEAEQVFYEHRAESLVERAMQKSNNKIEQQRLLARAMQVESEMKEAALRHSYAGRIGTFLEPVTLMAGFDWKINTALIGGFAAKEVILSNLATAYSLSSDSDDQSSLAEKIQADQSWTKAKVYAFLIFVLLYAPCVVSLVAIASESGSKKWAIFSFVFNTLLAFALAVLVFHIFTAIGAGAGAGAGA